MAWLVSFLIAVTVSCVDGCSFASFVIEACDIIKASDPNQTQVTICDDQHRLAGLCLLQTFPVRVPGLDHSLSSFPLEVPCYELNLPAFQNRVTLSVDSVCSSPKPHTKAWRQGIPQDVHKQPTSAEASCVACLR
eukprot:2600789-Amphidinium_carterae.1